MPAYPSATRHVPVSPPVCSTRFLPESRWLLSLAMWWMAGQAGLMGQCFTPGGLAAQEVTPSSLTLDWIDPGNADSVEFEVRTGNTPFNGMPTHTGLQRPWTIAGLVPATRHRVRIRSVCGQQRSAWATLHLDVTTASFNPSPCGLFFRIDDDNCPAYNTFYMQVDQAPGQQLGRDVALSAVELVVRHTFLADLHISLVSPSGQEVRLFTEHGQSRDHLGNPADQSCVQVCRFSSRDCAALDPVAHTGAFTGIFRPDEDLHRFDDGGSPIGIWQLRICDDARADTGSLRSLALIFDPLDCPAVYAARVGAVTETTAALSWSVTGEPEAFLIEYGPPGFQPGSADIPGQSATLVEIPGSQLPEWTLQGLDPGTAYEVYLRTRCAGGAFSVNTCLRTFNTDCVTGAPQAHREHFDGLTPCGAVCPCGTLNPLGGLWRNRTDTDDMDWLTRQGPASNEIQTGPSGDVSGGGNYLFLQTLQAACQSGARAHLQSSCLAVDTSTAVQCHLAFHYHMWGAAMGTLQVEASRNGGVTWTTLWTLGGNQGRNWKKAFVDLADYRGDTLQLRFSGISGPGRTSQMALDEIALHGVTLLGEPDRLWYRDEDGDGFGDAQRFVRTCNAAPPPGYVANALDCNDTHATIFPGAPEIPCNGVDENCNGLADDPLLPRPQAPSLTVCEGESALLAVTSPLFGEAYWYRDPEQQVLLGQGPVFHTGPILQDTLFWVKDSVANSACGSALRLVAVQVHLRPQLLVPALPGYCQGDSLELADLPVQDVRNTGAVLSYHSGLPATSTNVVSGKIIASAPSNWVVLATSPQGCTDQQTFSLPVWPNPEVLILQGDTLKLCARQAALLVAQAGGGQAPYQFQWSHGFSQFVAPALAGAQPGSQTLQVTVTDNHGCRNSDQCTVITLSSPGSATSVITDVTSCGGEDGAISLTPDGPGPFHYLWSGPTSGQALEVGGPFQISGLKQGSYRITITESATACPLVLPPTVVNGPGPVVRGINIDAESCPMEQDGAIALDMDGPPATFLWSGGQQGPVITGLPPGVYAVTISGGPCTYVVTDLEVPAAEPMVLGTTIRPVRCAGGMEGEIEVTVSGGVPPYAYEWAHGAYGPKLESLASGSYMLTITDAKGCSISSGAIILPASPVLDVQVLSAPPSCHDASDGWIRLLVQGGQPSYQVQWLDGGTGRERQGLASGQYAYTITDQAGCTWIGGPVALQAPAPLQAAWTAPKAETCQGAGDGSLSAEVSGGTQPYHFMWQDGTADSLRTDLPAGTYGLTVTDQAGCRVMLSPQEIGLANPLSLAVRSLQHPRCASLADGRIEIEVAGGSGSYAWLWSDGATNPVLSGVGAGNYQVTVTDLLGCSATMAGLVLTETSPLKVLVKGVYFPECGLGSEGDIVLSVFGVAPYTYAWSNGFTGSDPKGLTPGFYSVTVEDALGCIQSLESIPVINTEEQYKAAHVEIVHGRCHGDRNGSVTVEIRGGQAPYQFNWSNGQDKGRPLPLDGIDELAPGTYSVTVTDNRGCVLHLGPYEVQEPAPLTLSVPAGQIGNVTCLGAGDGRIHLDISGGVGPYATVWFRDSLAYSLDQHPRNLIPGKYTVYVEDRNGCTKSLSQPIEIYGPPTMLSWQGITVTQDTCSAEQTGAIELKMIGGVPEYAYLWADGQTGRVRTGLGGGWHCVSVTDQYLCVRDTCIMVPGGSGMDVDVLVLHECDPFSSAEASVSGGVPPYDWLWSHGETSPSPQGMPTGVYSLTVTDGLGCAEVRRDIGIGHPILYIESAYGIPASPAGFDGKAVVVPRGGTPPYTILWDVNTGSQVGDTAHFLAPGTFCVLVTDAFQCFDTACVKVALSTSLEEVRLPDGKIGIHPNPAREQVFLTWMRQEESPALGRIVLNATDGRRRVWQEAFSPGWTQIALDLPGLPSGVYTLQAFDLDGGLILTERVVLLGP